MVIEPTDEQVKAACELVWTASLSVRDACTMVKMTPGQIRGLQEAIAGETPARPDWQEWVNFATAQARAHWQGKAREYAEEKNATGAKVALEQLKALEPERYKKDESRVGAPVQVIIYQKENRPEEGKLGAVVGEKIIEFRAGETNGQA